MKIIKVASKKVGDVEYSKYVLNLPKKLVEESGFVGKDLKGKFEKGKISLEVEN